MKEKKTLKEHIQNMSKGAKLAVTSLGLLGMVSTVALPPVYAEARAQLKSKAYIDEIEVTGYAPDRRGVDYIGLTVDTNGNGRFDIDDENFEPIEVSGKFNESFLIIFMRNEVAGKSYTVALWDRKVYDCDKEDPWCDKYDYILEEELDRDYGKIKKTQLDW